MRESEQRENKGSEYKKVGSKVQDSIISTKDFLKYL